MSSADPEHREEDEAPAPADDEDTGAQVAPIVKLEEVEFFFPFFCHHLCRLIVAVLATMSVQEHAGNDKSCVWHARDFADGELKDELFCIRFPSVEID
ncbi:hypothetical protein AHAS_Ahas09G0288400 [Arachis hypogaea]